jgi:transitional endoplasmic reticulum ATPase
MKRRRYASSAVEKATILSALKPTALLPVTRLWILRMLVPMGGIRIFVESWRFADTALAVALGFKPFDERDEADDDDAIGGRERRFRYDGKIQSMEKMYLKAESQLLDSEAPAVLKSNIARLAGLVGLSSQEQRILEFAAMLKTDRHLEVASGMLGEMSGRQVIDALASVLDLPSRDVRVALNGQGALARTGLIKMDRDFASSLSDSLDLLSDEFAERIVSADAEPVFLLPNTIRPAQPPKLALDAYPHMASSLNLLQPYLQQAMQAQRRGVNVFLYGLPGTGKSELAKALAKDAQCELFEVASEDGDGDPVTGKERLCAFRAAQSFLANHRTMMLFDESEDVFGDGDDVFGRRSTAQKRKAWMNRMLEDNPLPTFWLSNRVDCMDPAFIRRFDMVIELPVPPKAQRERIVREACPDQLDAATVVRIAESSAVAPALITRAGSVIESIRPLLAEAQASVAVEHLINGTLKAQGHCPIRRNDPTRLPETYDPAFIHADADLVAIGRNLVQARSGRLCLYGPPGTGKTAYGRWLAEQLGISIHIKRASDLLSMWVGESEQNIAGAFRCAENEGALLLIDEVDSFLQDRRGATRSWEITQVNEMLTQMESFAGVFIASTNLMAGLDQAALRRFDLKVKLDFLRPVQAWGLLERTCALLGLPTPPEGLRTPLSRLTQLTPGDFATLARQHRFRPIVSAHAMVLALTAEVDLKEGAKAAIGFV